MSLWQGHQNQIIEGGGGGGQKGWAGPPPPTPLKRICACIL